MVSGDIHVRGKRKDYLSMVEWCARIPIELECYNGIESYFIPFLLLLSSFPLLFPYLKFYPFNI